MRIFIILFSLVYRYPKEWGGAKPCESLPPHSSYIAKNIYISKGKSMKEKDCF